MSGTHNAPTARGATQALRLPRVRGQSPDSIQVNAAMDLIERADASSVKTGQQPTFPGVVLLSPSRIGYLLSVNDAGALVVTQLPPTRNY
jgi:hypothetical protein